MSHYNLTQSIRESKAQRYLAKKRWERKQKFINIFLGFSITFITAVTITTGLIMWADALA